jgi:hypothetical protein
VSEPTDLDVLARAAGTTTERIHELNPELRRWCTPARLRGPPLPGQGPEGDQGHGGRRPGPHPASERLTYRIHHVRKGDTLSRIALQYHSAPEAILQFNRLRSAKTLRSTASSPSRCPRRARGRGRDTASSGRCAGHARRATWPPRRRTRSRRDSHRARRGAGAGNGQDRGRRRQDPRPVRRAERRLDVDHRPALQRHGGADPELERAGEEGPEGLQVGHGADRLARPCRRAHRGAAGRRVGEGGRSCRRGAARGQPWPRRRARWQARRSTSSPRARRCGAWPSSTA